MKKYRKRYSKSCLPIFTKKLKSYNITDSKYYEFLLEVSTFLYPLIYSDNFWRIAIDEKLFFNLPWNFSFQGKVRAELVLGGFQYSVCFILIITMPFFSKFYSLFFTNFGKQNLFLYKKEDAWIALIHKFKNRLK